MLAQQALLTDASGLRQMPKGPARKGQHASQLRASAGYELGRTRKLWDEPPTFGDNIRYRRAGSTAHVFIKPVDCALPCEIGSGFVVPFRSCVAIEAMHGARINVTFMRNVRGR